MISDGAGYCTETEHCFALYASAFRLPETAVREDTEEEVDR